MILEVFSCFDGSMILWYWLHFKQIHQSAFHWIYSTWKRIIQNLKKYTVLNHVIVYFPYCIYYYDCINQCVNRKCIQKKKKKKMRSVIFWKFSDNDLTDSIMCFHATRKFVHWKLILNTESVMRNIMFSLNHMEY